MGPLVQPAKFLASFRGSFVVILGLEGCVTFRVVCPGQLCSDGGSTLVGEVGFFFSFFGRVNQLFLNRTRAVKYLSRHLGCCYF